MYSTLCIIITASRVSFLPLNSTEWERERQAASIFESIFSLYSRQFRSRVAWISNYNNKLKIIMEILRSANSSPLSLSLNESIIKLLLMQKSLFSLST